MRVPHGRSEVVDVLQRLRENEAVERGIRDRVCGGQVRDERGERVAGVDVEDVRPRHALSEALTVATVLHFEHAPLDMLAILRQEALDVIPVDGRAAVVAEVVAESASCGEARPAAQVAIADGSGQEAPVVVRTGGS